MLNKQKIDHIGIIIDGNRRWAKRHGLPSLFGHKKGYKQIKKMVRWCLDRDIRYLTVYAFSTENWKRKKSEVSYLMNLFRTALLKDVDEMQKNGIRIRIIGQKNRLPKDIQKLISTVEKKTKKNNTLTLQLAISYGGRAEILEAIQKIVKKKIPSKKITEKIFESYLWTSGVPDPDMIIRTSGELRISGFLTWQSVYSELYFTDVLWPSFSEKNLDEAIEKFTKRERRFGR